MFLKIREKLSFKNPRLSILLSVFIFIVALNCLYSYVGIYKFIEKRPCSIHISAQTSRASIALNYYENNMNFFTPQQQKTLDGKGYTGLEFPVIYYMGAICYKLFGFNEMYPRLISLVILSLGLLMFYLLSLQYSKSKFLSLGIVVGVAVSPVLMFYSANFMPDPPSLGLILTAWFFFFKYLKTNTRKHLNLFVVFGTLAVLLKVTAAICFVIVFILMLLDNFKFFRQYGKEYLFPEKKKLSLRMLLGLLLVVLWYKGSALYTSYQGGETFMMSVNMYENWEGLLNVLSYMRDLWLNHYYSYESYVLLACVTGSVILGFKLVDRLLFTITFLYIGGCLCYFILFLNQFIFHDYYVIMMFPALFFLFLCFADIFGKISERYFYPVIPVFLVVLIFNLKESVEKTRISFYERNSSDIFYWTGDYRAYEDLEPKLRKLGIKREDRVVNGYDETDCAGLYLMNQLGINFGPGTSQRALDSCMQHKNAKYLVLNDSAKFRKDFGYNIPEKVIATHRGLIIYKLK